jgi:hypothetical protein
MTCVDSLAARFYRLKSRHAATGTYLKQFEKGEDDKCFTGKGGTINMREFLFCHYSLCKEQQHSLWNAVEKATGWIANTCRHVQISELLPWGNMNKY